MAFQADAFQADAFEVAAEEEFRDAVLALGPIAYWRLDDTGSTLVDATGNGHDGTYNGSPPTDTGALLNSSNEAHDFDGSSQYVEFTNQTAFNLGNAPLSLMAWAKRESGGDALQFVFSKRDSSYAIGFDDSDDKFFLSKQGVAQIATESGTSPVDDGWHFYVATRAGSASGETLIYKDGADVTSFESVQTLADGTSSIHRIARTSNGTSYFSGDLDEIALFDYVLSAAEIQALYEAAGYGGSPVVRTAADALALGDVVARVGTLLRGPNDGLTLADAATRTGAFIRAATDSLGLSDVATRITTLVRTTADPLALSDAVTRTGTLLRTGADSLGLSDAATRIGTLIRTTADGLALSDAATALKLIVRTAADALGLSDAATRVGTFLRSIAGGLTLADAATRTGTWLRSVTQGLTLSDAATRAQTSVRSVADTLGLSDAAARAGTFLRSVTQGLTLSDAAVRVKLTIRTATDALGLSDAATRAITVVRTAADSLQLGDVVTSLRLIIRTITDALGLTDSADAIVSAPEVEGTVTVSDVSAGGSMVLDEANYQVAVEDEAYFTVTVADE